MNKRSIFLTPLIILIIALLGGFVLTFVIFYAVLLLLALSYLWVHLSIRRIEIQVKGASDKYTVGQLLEEQVTVYNHGRFPTASLVVEEQSDVPGYRNGRVLTLNGRSSFKWENTVPCQLRGSFILGSFKVTSEDPFGLFHLTRVLGTPREVMVYPSTVDLADFRLVSPRTQGAGANYHSIRSIAPSAAWVRDYSSGDGLSRIHWRSTAHMGKLMVKEFDIELSEEVWIALDLCMTGQVGSGKESTVEYGVTIAASLARKYLESDCSLGLVAYGDKVYRILAQAGINQLSQVMESLVVMKAEGKKSMAQVLYRERGMFGFNTRLIVVTHQMDSELKTVLQRYRWGKNATTILIDRSSFQEQANRLSSSGTLLDNGGHLYVVRKGDELERALSIFNYS